MEAVAFILIALSIAIPVWAGKKFIFGRKKR